MKIADLTVEEFEDMLRKTIEAEIEDLYRLRTGEYRVIFEWRGSQINVARILTRQDFGKKY